MFFKMILKTSFVLENFVTTAAFKQGRCLMDFGMFNKITHINENFRTFGTFIIHLPLKVSSVKMCLEAVRGLKAPIAMFTFQRLGFESI